MKNQIMNEVLLEQIKSLKAQVKELESKNREFVFQQDDNGRWYLIPLDVLKKIKISVNDDPEYFYELGYECDHPSTFIIKGWRLK